MSTHTRTPARVQDRQRLRPAPLALGTFLALVTASVLFDDVRHGAEITTSHALALAALVAALASGHMAWPQLRAWRIAPGLALALLFAASTLYVVVSSGTRNAETAATRQLAAADAQRQRDDITRMRREAETILAACTPGTPREHLGIRCGLRDAMTAECGSGKGSRCTGRTYSVTTYEAAIAGYDAQLARLGPPPAPSGYAHAARVFAALPGITAAPDDIAQRLALLLPFLAVLICELGTLVFLHLGLGHAAPIASADHPAAAITPPRSPGAFAGREPAAAINDQQSPPYAPADEAARLAAFLASDDPALADRRPDDRIVRRTVRRGDGGRDDGPERPGRPERPRPLPDGRKGEVLAGLLTDLALGRTVGQSDIIERYGVPRSTASDWLREWEAAGLIPTRRTVGRCKVVAG